MTFNKCELVIKNVSYLSQQVNKVSKYNIWWHNVIYIIVNYIQAWAYSKQAYINEVVTGSGKFSF